MSLTLHVEDYNKGEYRGKDVMHYYNFRKDRSISGKTSFLMQFTKVLFQLLFPIYGFRAHLLYNKVAFKIKFNGATQTY